MLQAYEEHMCYKMDTLFWPSVDEENFQGREITRRDIKDDAVLASEYFRHHFDRGEIQFHYSLDVSDAKNLTDYRSSIESVKQLTNVIKNNPPNEKFKNCVRSLSIHHIIDFDVQENSIKFVAYYTHVDQPGTYKGIRNSLSAINFLTEKLTRLNIVGFLE